MSEPPPSGVMRLPPAMTVPPAARPLRILFVYSRVPLPMTRGDELTVSHLLEFLHARGHHVDFFTLDDGQGLAPAHRAWLESRCRRLTILPQPRLRSAIAALRGLLAGRPLQIGWFRNPAQLRAVAEALGRESYDVAYAYYIRSAETLRRVRRGRGPATFLALQLSQYLNTKRLAETTRSPVQRLLFGIESRLIRRYEAWIWRDFTRTVLIGPSDLAAVRTACREEGVPEIDNVVFGPHGVDTERFAPRPEVAVEPGSVVFSGAMRYPPNAQAVLWFAEKVWPKVRAGRSDAKLYVVGRDPPPPVTALGGRDGIEVTGTVPDPADWMAKAAVCVAPIRAAAGLQNKLLEYLAMAKAVVATAAANEGIGAMPGRDLVTADDPAAMADAVLTLLADPARAQALGEAGRAFVVARWTWEAHFFDLEKAFLQAIEEVRGGVGKAVQADGRMPVSAMT